MNILFLKTEFLTWNDLLNFRAISKNIKAKIENLCDRYFSQADDLVPAGAGLASTISVSNCQHCYKNFDNESRPGFTTFIQDDHPGRVIVRCKDNWRCRFVALTTRNNESALDNLYFTTSPILDEDETCVIPRSSGETQIAYPLNKSLVYWNFRDSKLGIPFLWEDELNMYTKAVPLEMISRHKGKLSDAQKFIIKSKFVPVLPEEIIRLIVDFITRPPPIKANFLKWEGSSIRVPPIQ